MHTYFAFNISYFHFHVDNYMYMYPQDHFRLIISLTGPPPPLTQITNGGRFLLAPTQNKMLSWGVTVNLFVLNSRVWATLPLTIRIYHWCMWDNTMIVTLHQKNHLCMYKCNFVTISESVQGVYRYLRGESKVILIPYTVGINQKGCGLLHTLPFTSIDQEDKMVRLSDQASLNRLWYEQSKFLISGAYMTTPSCNFNSGSHLITPDDEDIPHGRAR